MNLCEALKTNTQRMHLSLTSNGDNARLMAPEEVTAFVSAERNLNWMKVKDRVYFFFSFKLECNLEAVDPTQSWKEQHLCGSGLTDGAYQRDQCRIVQEAPWISFSGKSVQR